MNDSEDQYPTTQDLLAEASEITDAANRRETLQVYCTLLNADMVAHKRIPGLREMEELWAAAKRAVEVTK